jgi:hypothetical protein
MRRSCLILMAVLGGLALTSSVGAQPETMTLRSPASQSQDRPPVLFTHGRHIEDGFSCKECHHRYEQGKNVLEESDLEPGKPGIRCQECHGPGGRGSLEEVFHRQCLGCHQKMAKEGRKNIPRYCGECHVKK